MSAWGNAPGMNCEIASVNIPNRNSGFTPRPEIANPASHPNPESQFGHHTQVRNRKSGFTPQPGIAAQASHRGLWKPHSP
jgi:hypothetical protein